MREEFRCIWQLEKYWFSQKELRPMLTCGTISSLPCVGSCGWWCLQTRPRLTFSNRQMFVLILFLNQIGILECVGSRVVLSVCDYSFVEAPTIDPLAAAQSFVDVRRRFERFSFFYAGSVSGTYGVQVRQQIVGTRPWKQKSQQYVCLLIPASFWHPSKHLVGKV